MTDRGDIPERLRNLLTSPANVAIHGLPGSGKSWIGDQVARLLGDTETPVIRVDLSTASSGKDVFIELLLGLDTVSEDRESCPTDIRDVWRSVRSLLTSSDQHVVFVLDEFDRVLQFDDVLDFLLLFRELVHRPESLRCTTLIMSRRSLQSIETRVSGISTLATVCYTQYLGSLGVDDLADLGPGTSDLTGVEKAECLLWSGGHPVLAKYWLTTRPDVSPDPSGDMEQVKVALRVLDHLTELQLIDAAAQCVLGPIVDDLFFERQELEVLGVLSASGEQIENSISLSKQQSFREALRFRTWGLNPWGILGNAEVRLRGLIDNILMDTYGEDWAVEVAKKSEAVRNARSSALEKQARDSKMFSRHAPWLSYTYPMDLWQIIRVEWELFASVFSTHDKAHWNRVMTGLSQYRAPLAHGRPDVLGEVQRTECRLFAEQILTKISSYEKSRLGSAI